MSRSAPEPAADAAAPAPAAAKKVLTRVKLDEDARTRVLLRKHAHDAATWAHENNVGVRKAISTGNFGGATRNMVHPLLKERHFHSEFGLEAELIDASIMDPETKMIRDPRRVLNVDETPQPLDAPQKGSRKKVAKRQCAREFGRLASTELGIPVFLYGHAASAGEHRKLLPQVREGQYEGLAEKLTK